MNNHYQFVIFPRKEVIIKDSVSEWQGKVNIEDLLINNKEGKQK